MLRRSMEDAHIYEMIRYQPPVYTFDVQYQMHFLHVNESKLITCLAERNMIWFYCRFLQFNLDRFKQAWSHWMQHLFVEMIMIIKSFHFTELPNQFSPFHCCFPVLSGKECKVRKYQINSNDMNTSMIRTARFRSPFISIVQPTKIAKNL